MNQDKSADQNPNSPECKFSKDQNEIWEMKRKRINEKRTKSGKPLSKWHASRLRILEEEDDYASFIQYIKWMGGKPPNEDNINEIDYLDELTREFDSLGGYEFFEEHKLSPPPIGIGGYESTFFD